MAPNDGFDYRERLGADAEGCGLLDYLAGRWRHSSAAEWEARLARGAVLLDDAPAGPGTVVRRGQTLRWRRPPWEEPAAPTDFDVLLEDRDLLAVSKPAGLPTLPGAGFLRHTLLHLVRRRDPEATPLHRLGRHTSGIVLFARTAEMLPRLAAQWADRSVDKRYRASASGSPAAPEWTVATPIGRVPHPSLGTVHAASPAGKAAVSHVTVLEARAGGFLCDVRIATGRPHQIRIHLAASGHPLIGDPLYVAGGLPAPGSRAVPGDPGYSLHAAELGFRHPRDEREVRIACEPPPALRRAAEGPGADYTGSVRGFAGGAGSGGPSGRAGRSDQAVRLASARSTAVQTSSIEPNGLAR